MKNKNQDLRNHLFGILEGLTDPQTEVSEDFKQRAKLAVSVSQAIINSAKVEIDYMRTARQMDEVNPFFAAKQIGNGSA